MSKYKLVLIALVHVSLLISSGCSGSLSRSKAAELISKKLESAEVKSLDLYPGVQSYANREAMLAAQDDYGIMARLGYMDCRMTQGGVDAAFGKYVEPYCQVVLTDKGTKASSAWRVFMKGELLSTVTIPVGKPQLVEVTGISTKENEATATFTWNYAPMNEIGQTFAAKQDYGKLTSGTALFQKFDDGWRLMSY